VTDVLILYTAEATDWEAKLPPDGSASRPYLFADQPCRMRFSKCFKASSYERPFCSASCFVRLSTCAAISADLSGGQPSATRTLVSSEISMFCSRACQSAEQITALLRDAATMQGHFTVSRGAILILMTPMRLSGRSCGCVGVVAIFSKTSSPLISLPNAVY